MAMMRRAEPVRRQRMGGMAPTPAGQSRPPNQLGWNARRSRQPAGGSVPFAPGGGGNQLQAMEGQPPSAGGQPAGGVLGQMASGQPPSMIANWQPGGGAPQAGGGGQMWGQMAGGGAYGGAPGATQPGQGFNNYMQQYQGGLNAANAGGAPGGQPGGGQMNNMYGQMNAPANPAGGAPAGNMFGQWGAANPAGGAPMGGMAGYMNALQGGMGQPGGIPAQPGGIAAQWQPGGGMPPPPGSSGEFADRWQQHFGQGGQPPGGGGAFGNMWQQQNNMNAGAGMGNIWGGPQLPHPPTDRMGTSAGRTQQFSTL